MAQRLCPVVIGRDKELAALRSALESALAGDGRTVFLSGEPGIGKSRLAQEVAAWARQVNVPVVTGRAIPTSASTPFRPLTEVLMQLFRRASLPDDPNLAPWLPLLHPLLPTLVDAPPSSAEAEGTLRGEAVLQLFIRGSATGLVVVLEDLHWADPDSVSLVEYLADNVAGTSVLLVATVRDRPHSPISDVARRVNSRSTTVNLVLDRLDRDEMSAMVRACQPDAAPDLVDRIHEASDGVPLLVEDLLASPGWPADFAETVRSRLEAIPTRQRQVIEAAAVLGRQFEWELLSPMTGQAAEAVGAALQTGIESLLLTSHAGELRFRHALTRDAVLDLIFPPEHRQLAARGLSAVLSAHVDLSTASRELAIDLATRAGERFRAGQLLAAAGRESLAWGALATAAESLKRAGDLLTGSPEQAAAELDLIEALGMSGRVDDAAAAGGRLIQRLGPDEEGSRFRLEAHVRLAHAAVEACRWQMVRHHLELAHRISQNGDDPRARGPIRVLEAELAMSCGDYEQARSLAEGVRDSEDASGEVLCHALEIIGRSQRSSDLSAARASFDRALVIAEASNLPLWRLRALHELGTIDLFDHVGVERLLQARETAQQLGALSTAAILDLQLAAGFTGRWDLESCDAHANAAIEVAEQLGLHQVKAKAFAMLTGSAGMRGDLAATERYAALAVASDPEDAMLDGFCWGMRGMARLVAGQEDEALDPWARGMAVLSKLPHAEPASVRALWPLLLASRGDRRARSAIDEARRLNVGAFGLNRAMIGYAEAILAGRSGDGSRARLLAGAVDPGWSNCLAWSDLARLLAAPLAVEDGWADIHAWLAGAADRFREKGLPALAARCDDLLARGAPNPWSSAGISSREADVLRLLAEGLANKEIASRLGVSPRTVEKHVESLLRKSGTRSRTELVARFAPSRVPGQHRQIDTT